MRILSCIWAAQQRLLDINFAYVILLVSEVRHALPGMSCEQLPIVHLRELNQAADPLCSFRNNFADFHIIPRRKQCRRQNILS